MTLFDDSLTLLQTLVRNACVNDLTPDSGQEVRNADSLEEFFCAEIAAGRDSGAVTVQRLIYCFQYLQLKQNTLQQEMMLPL